jgi:archaeal flagellar protein FlaJ
MKGLERWNLMLTNILLPGIRKHFEQLGVWAGKSDSWRNLVGIFMTFGIIGFIVFVVVANLSTLELSNLRKLMFLGFAILSLILSIGMPYILLYFVADKRKSFVESVLPDALQMISANLRAGVTPYEAVRSASIEDFGPLGKEFERVTNMSVGNVSFSKTLLTVCDSFDSAALTRSMKLFASSIKAGGHLAELLENLAIDINERHSLKRELVTNTTTNSMFIMFTIVVGTPMLLAISIYFVDVVTGLQGSSGDGSGFGLGSIGGDISIDSPFLINISYVMLFMTGVLACMFIGAMIDGEAKKGLKWAPVIIGASYGVFFVARFLVVYMLGSTL